MRNALAAGFRLFRLIGPENNEVDSLAFETLMPKPILQRYVSLLTEHRRVIFCGSSGTGKTFLAHKLAEYLTQRSVSLHTGNEFILFIRQQCKSEAPIPLSSMRLPPSGFMQLIWEVIRLHDAPLIQLAVMARAVDGFDAVSIR